MDEALFFDEVSVDHIRLYVHDLESASLTLGEKYGLASCPFDLPACSREAERSRSFCKEDICIVLTQPLVPSHPGSEFLQRHGEGVADIALAVPDATQAFTLSVARGAVPHLAAQQKDGIVTASIFGAGNLIHTFVQREASRHRRSPDTSGRTVSGLHAFDHFALCLQAGDLAATCAFYMLALDFSVLYEEKIVVGKQSMNSKVVQNRSGRVTLTLIEPDLSYEAGQIDSFIQKNKGAGVQHIALRTTNIVKSVQTLAEKGVGFLKSPRAYYQQLPERLESLKYDVDKLMELSLLADQDHAGQLYQIFAKPSDPDCHFFFEIIERVGAKTFGSSNIKALYDSVEMSKAS
ncbi:MULTISPECIES: 4-hydroxyphenylpyruvate dioxygenase [Pseudomonas syringae group]|jgi:4-hydroxymandelate synthase|uniref:4-hydroxyphenylpyruvate dioxygenase n=2 Tax=Pseudomonas syringae group TaxID=136849 RepID=A0A0Q0DVV3_PSEA0|nr:MULTISPECIES: 4-hydroxyphenylpyruvate dioxygenase [Pseudomonas syringae group]KPW59909.1 4-hydroxyphenylpyruvate dioxygenase [Pseudomonas syringae pv. berberidis]KPZ05055.1 4-hydroxyphenylpyruvate dioxygenase [Pseudomonas amygdali pv. ulmi]KWS36847.1 4-hydroxyphenylpyruvate dioxygenase [Pseudomonas amygdali pv. ulmi]KWS62539.1 4-hydroxyphenylpyruvate dioxygenase [Pseudomonas amygdali pv. morsprunorum]NAS98816.1 4-hydroxyphenylpyruvate dioxygenase [Pseudomonas syringae pv. actinidifoliorum]